MLVENELRRKLREIGGEKKRLKVARGTTRDEVARGGMESTVGCMRPPRT